MTIHEILRKLVKSSPLTRAEAAEVMRQLMTGESTSAQTGAFLAVLAMNQRSVEEITGFAETMRAFATRIKTVRRPVVDTCGTGGDHSGTFNISTTAAFVVAGAGVSVAKHGNRSATSKCGSADVLEQLGVNITATPEMVGQCIDEIGIGFLFARTLHNAMKHVAAVRGELGIPTIFNILGPLTNPAGAEGQIIGVYDRSLLDTIGQVLLNLGARHVFVVSGHDGLDEITLTGSTDIVEGRDGQLFRYEFHPERFGISCVDKSELQGGDRVTNARLLREVLEGRAGAHRDVVLINSAPAIVAGGAAATLEEGLFLARESISSGAALEKLNALISVSHEEGRPTG